MIGFLVINDTFLINSLIFSTMFKSLIIIYYWNIINMIRFIYIKKPIQNHGYI